MRLAILGLGTALPRYTVSQGLVAEIAQTVSSRAGGAAVALSAFRRAGVQTRHTVIDPGKAYEWLGLPVAEDGTASGLGPSTGERMERYRDEARPLAVEAARAALADASIAPRSVSHLVTVSCTGFSAPGLDAGLIEGLGLRPTVERVHVGFMGCHGAINALRVARGLAAADPEAVILLAAVELCTLHFNSGKEPEKLIGNALFGDGAAAAVCAAAQGPGAGALRLAATGSSVFPDSGADMTWTIGDHGFEMALSRRVPALIEGRLRPWLGEWLSAQGVPLSGVASWAVHPGGPRIVSAVEEALGLGEAATAVSREVLAGCGNMSSPTILFILDRLRRRGAPSPCVALAFGPGLTAEAALFV